jgi:glutamine cyclotransferase
MSQLANDPIASGTLANFFEINFRKIMKVFFCISVVVMLSACNGKKSKGEKTANAIPYSIKKIFPHDKTAYIQGLTIADGRLFESTGQAGSWIAEVDIATGNQDKKVILDKRYFGEGITILNNKIYQLTWQSHIGFVYDFKTFNKIGEFKYDHEGWGITTDNKNLIVSDGTNKIRFLDTLTLRSTKEIIVKEGEVSVDQLNELEFIDGFIFANQWQTNYILKIDPTNGQVVGRMDLARLAEKIYPLNPTADVLNGIAYEKKSKSLLVTGKLWPALFALEIK